MYDISAGAAPIVPLVDTPLPQSRVYAVPLASVVLPQTTTLTPFSAWRVGMIRVSALALVAAIATRPVAINISRCTFHRVRVFNKLMFRLQVIASVRFLTRQ